METSKILQYSVKNLNVEPSKKSIAGKVLKFFLFIFMLSWIMVLSSCAVAVRTPRYNTSGVVIERHYRVNRPERSERHIRIERQNHRARHDNGRRGNQ